MGDLIFITGGVRSGKSAYAVELAMKYDKRLFLATAEAFDDEMKKRIEKHKRDRGSRFKTKEVPVYLANAINNVSNTDVCVVDCVTVWLNNLMHYNKLDEIDNFKKAIKQPVCDLIVVSNEVGMGIMPNNKMARRYVDLLGGLNKAIAESASEVFLMISSMALKIKGG